MDFKGFLIYGVSIPFKREGKGRHDVERRKGNGAKVVSIPFKREGKVDFQWEGNGSVLSDMFQFPSNGKVRGRPKPEDETIIVVSNKMFQFPSNGKVRVDQRKC